MGDPKRPRPWRMQWEATLGGMARHGSIVVRLCKLCGAMTPVDVDAMIARFGEEASLWNSFWPCEAVGCEDGLTGVHASPGHGSPLRPLSDYNVWSDLKGGWLYLPVWPGQSPYHYMVVEYPLRRVNGPGMHQGSRL